MKKMLLLLLTTFMFAQPEVEWTQTFGEEGTDDAHSVHQRFESIQPQAVQT
jgi:hypothetical protein